MYGYEFSKFNPKPSLYSIPDPDHGLNCSHNPNPKCVGAISSGYVVSCICYLTEVDNDIKLRALVAMSKMNASSGGNIHQKIVADGAGQRLHKQVFIT